MSIFANTAAQNNCAINTATADGSLEYLFGECVAADFDAGAFDYSAIDIQNQNYLTTSAESDQSQVWQRFVVDNAASVRESCTAFDGQAQRRVRRGNGQNVAVLAGSNKCGFKRSKYDTKPKSTKDFDTFTTTTQCYFMPCSSYRRSSMPSIHGPGHSIISGPGLPPPPQLLQPHLQQQQ